MRGIKELAHVAAGAAKAATKTGGEALKATGNAMHVGAKFISTHQSAISTTTTAALEASAKAIESTGKAITCRANAVARDLRDSNSSNDLQGTRVLRATGYRTADALGALGRLTGRLGTGMHKISPAIGAATGSAISGIAGTFSGAVDSAAVTDRDFESLYVRLVAVRKAARSEMKRKNRAIFSAQRDSRKKELLDLLVVGGSTLLSIVLDPSETPANVERAFALAYPVLAASGETFSDAVQRIPAEDLIGLVSGVKGKLFEIELVDDLNSGRLPESFHAELAGSPIQAGYDVKIIDGDGHAVELLQAKATESVYYVKEALERYPDIDIVTTTEVYAQLAAIGALDRVTDSGMGEQALEDHVLSATTSDTQCDIGDIVPSSVGLAVIFLSSFRDGNVPLELRGAEFGNRAVKAGIASVAAQAIFITTNTWWLALAAGAGSRWLTSYGANKRERYESLEEAVRFLEVKAERSKFRYNARRPLPRALEDVVKTSSMWLGVQAGSR